MRVAIYGRVSTDRQTHDSQLGELRDYATRRGWSAPAEFLDTASGAKTDRAELARLMALVRAGRVDTILCHKLDRLGRSLSHLAQIIEELRLHRVALVVPSQGIDTTASNPAASFQLAILAAVAEFERAIITERVRSGVAAARVKGTKLGRPGTLHKHSAAVAALVAQGKGTRAIGRELNLSPASVDKIRKTLDKQVS